MGFTSHATDLPPFLVVPGVRMPSTWPSWLRSLGLGPPHGGVGSILSLDSCGAAEPGTPFKDKKKNEGVTFASRNSSFFRKMMEFIGFHGWIEIRDLHQGFTSGISGTMVTFASRNSSFFWRKNGGFHRISWLDLRPNM